MKKIAVFIVLLFLSFNFYGKNQSDVFIQLGHASTITSVVMTKDNRYIISSSKDKTIKIWDVASNTLIRTLSGHSAGINMIALSPDDKLLASASSDKSVKIWDLEKEVCSYTAQSYSSDFVGFSKDGKYIFSSGANDNDTNIWDLNGKKLRTKFDNNYCFYGVAFSPDGKLLAMIGSNPAILSADSYTVLRKIETQDLDFLDFSPDSKTILTSTGYGMEIIDVQTGKQIKKICKDDVKKALFTKDGKRIVSMDYSGDIKIWDVEKSVNIKILKSHEDSLTDIFVSADGKKLVSSSEDNSIKLWDLDTYKLINTFKSNSYAVNSIAVSNDGKFAVTGSDDRTMRVWDFTEAKLSYSFSKNADLVLGVAVSPDNKNVVMSERDLKYFDAVSGKILKTFTGEKYYFGAPVLFSSNGKFILTCDRNNDILFIDINTGKVIRKYHGHTSSIKSLSFSPDGKFFVSGGYDRTVRFWNLNISSNELTTLTDHTDDVTVAMFSPDGRYVASGSTDGTLLISETDYDAGFLRPVTKFKTRPISTLCYTPDGKKIIIGSFDKTVSVYDVGLNKETDVFNGHQSTVRGIAVSKDGKFAFSSSWDSTTKIWNLETRKEVAMLAGFSDGEWVIITPEGYFNASPNGARYLTVKAGVNYYTMDNYLETFFRPDLVKLALAGINLKDFSKLDDVQLAPNVSILGCDVNNDEAEVSVKITDNGGGIGDIRLFLNDSAIALENGRGLKGEVKDGSIVKKFKVKLQNGENSIKAIAFNDTNSMQSNRSEKTVEYRSQTLRKPSLYALVIGINEYENENLELQYAVPDAMLLSDTLKKTSQSLFDKVEIKVLTKKAETTKDSIIKSLLSFKNFNPEDLFVFYIASHGTVSDGEFFLVTSNVGATSTKKLKEDALSQNFVKELIANIPTSKKLIILDTCNSQALGNDLQIALMTRGLSEDTAVKVLSRSVGVTILCAAKSNQEALEGYKDHGLFTYVLTEGLSGKADYDKDGYVKTFELADYIDNEVPNLAEKVFNVAQYPIVSPGGQGFPIGKIK
jgi:WD40 repeat protein